MTKNISEYTLTIDEDYLVLKYSLLSGGNPVEDIGYKDHYWYAGNLKIYKQTAETIYFLIGDQHDGSFTSLNFNLCTNISGTDIDDFLTNLIATLPALGGGGGGGGGDTNLIEIGGVAVDANIGTASDGTIRITVASDDPGTVELINIGTTTSSNNTLLTSIDGSLKIGTTSAAEYLASIELNTGSGGSSVNITQVGSTSIDRNSGVVGPGTIRTTIGTDDPISQSIITRDDVKRIQTTSDKIEIFADTFEDQTVFDNQWTLTSGNPADVNLTGDGLVINPPTTSVLLTSDLITFQGGDDDIVLEYTLACNFTAEQPEVFMNFILESSAGGSSETIQIEYFRRTPFDGSQPGADLSLAAPFGVSRANFNKDPITGEGILPALGSTFLDFTNKTHYRIIFTKNQTVYIQIFNVLINKYTTVHVITFQSDAKQIFSIARIELEYIPDSLGTSEIIYGSMSVYSTNFLNTQDQFSVNSVRPRSYAADTVVEIVRPGEEFFFGALTSGINGSPANITNDVQIRSFDVFVNTSGAVIFNLYRGLSSGVAGVVEGGTTFYTGSVVQLDGLDVNLDLGVTTNDSTLIRNTLIVNGVARNFDLQVENVIIHESNIVYLMSIRNLGPSDVDNLGWVLNYDRI